MDFISVVSGKQTVMKKVGEWFNELPEPQRSEAKENAGWATNLYAGSLTDALIFSFDWDESRQGFDYWDEISESCE